MPKTAFTSICMCHSFDYWLPYLWNGFGQNTKYSLRINNICDISAVFGNFENSKQLNIRKAEKILKVEKGMSAADFYSFFQHNKESIGSKVSFSWVCSVICIRHALMTILAK